MIHQRLEQKQLQKLSPQQILLMKLLQVPAISLEQRIKQEIEENPALDDEESEDLEANSEQDVPVDDGGEDSEETEERTDNEFEFSDYFDSEEYEVPEYKLNVNNQSPDEERKERPIVSGSSNVESLIDQLGMLTKSEREKTIAIQIIGNLEDYGYLERDLDAIADDLAFNQNLMVGIQEIENVLVNVIHQLDPAGVGARNLQECLLIQLRRHEEVKSKVVIRAIKIIENHFNEFTKKHYEKIISALGCSEDAFRLSLTEILKLNPKPGGASGEGGGSNYIIPDFYISNRHDKLELSLHQRNSPALRINNQYRSMYDFYANQEKRSKGGQEAAHFVRQKIDSAKWFIDAIEQRKNTLQITMEAIMAFQESFFLTGDESDLKPMILKDIAEVIGMDISTVSRVVNSKYVQTPFGTFLLKNFFSESLSTDSGEEVSSKEVKKILMDCISGEDKRKPVTDEELSKMLNSKGYHIARRTIAKYREQLGIPVARMRKEL